MPDSIDLGSYSVFVPPDPFEDHVGPFYYRIQGDAREGGQRALRAADRSSGTATMPAACMAAPRSPSPTTRSAWWPAAPPTAAPTPPSP